MQPPSVSTNLKGTEDAGTHAEMAMALAACEHIAGDSRRAIRERSRHVSFHCIPIKAGSAWAMA